MKRSIIPIIIFLMLISSCGGGDSNNESMQTSNSCNQEPNDYPCIEVGTYTTSDLGGGVGYYKMVMPSGGGNVITDAMNDSYARVFTSELQEFVVNPDPNNSNTLPFRTPTHLPEGEYIIEINEFFGSLSRFAINSTGIIDQSLLDLLRVGGYTSTDTDGFIKYYKLIVPDGGQYIVVTGINDSFAHVYTFDLEEFMVNPDPDNVNLFLNNTSTYLPEGNYVIAVSTRFGSLSLISFAF